MVEIAAQGVSFSNLIFLVFSLLIPQKNPTVFPPGVKRPIIIMTIHFASVLPSVVSVFLRCYMYNLSICALIIIAR